MSCTKATPNHAWWFKPTWFSYRRRQELFSIASVIIRHVVSMISETLMERQNNNGNLFRMTTFLWSFYVHTYFLKCLNYLSQPWFVLGFLFSSKFQFLSKLFLIKRYKDEFFFAFITITQSKYVLLRWLFIAIYFRASDTRFKLKGSIWFTSQTIHLTLAATMVCGKEKINYTYHQLYIKISRRHFCESVLS